MRNRWKQSVDTVCMLSVERSERELKAECGYRLYVVSWKIRAWSESRVWIPSLCCQLKDPSVKWKQSVDNVFMLSVERSEREVKAECGYRMYVVSWNIRAWSESRVWIPSVCCQLKDPSSDVAYLQFHQDYIGLPEDGAPDAPKHVGARRYSKHMAILRKKLFRWSFFHHKIYTVLV
jgi:hypothetical protein